MAAETACFYNAKMSELIYLDNNATTRPLEEVLDAQGAAAELYANPSSVHQFGQRARHLVECARAQVGRLINADAKEIIFTSGGTESINLAIRGLVSYRTDRRQVVTSAVEHSAVRRLCQQLVREGYRVDEIGVDGDGRLNIDELASKVTDDTALVSVMLVNNETGVVFNTESVFRVASDHDVPVHVDAVQGVGRIPIDVGSGSAAESLHLLSMSAHKFHGSKGVGALYVRKRTKLRPLVFGGQQESGLRAGTENVPAIVGMGVAAEALLGRAADEQERIRRMRDQFERDLCAAIPIARVNGAAAPRVANTTNIGFRGLQAEAILLMLSEAGICASAGSACSSGSLEPSHVLQAMSVDPEFAHGSIRFSLSRFTTEDELRRTVATMSRIVSRLAALMTA